ncbi:MAG TPA: rod shape-determining protein MreC [Gaiellaceae bacterium]|nr:rod shape-determining protein MreC [Gaiellaceae bacterium]
MTIAFRSPTSGPLHSVQGAGSTVLRPFQIAATRIAQPFRDGYDYVDGLANARAENKRLKLQIQALREKDIHNLALAAREPSLVQLLHFRQGRTFPDGYRAVNTAVASFPDGPYAHSLVIDAGSSSGVRVSDPVVSGNSLVGRVSNVFPDTAQVTLLTDSDSFVAARDLDTGVRGGIQAGTGGTLALNEVLKQYRVKKGDVIVTAGTHNTQYPDLYPYGIPIGRVSSVGATDTASFLQVQVQPFVNFGSIDSVAVLVPKNSRR